MMEVTSSNAVQVQPRSKKPMMAKSDASTASGAARSRHKVLHDYHDHSRAEFPTNIDVVDLSGGGRVGEKRKGPRGGVTVPFPIKLHVMLSKVEEHDLTHVVSWQPHGRCFVVHKPKEFVTEVMPTFFRQTKLTSFQRQLNLYGFSRITTGKDRGGYYHELFLKHKLFLCQNMVRIRIKGTGIKGKTSPETEPDFYAMPWVRPEEAPLALNRNLESEVTAAMEEENKRVVEPSKGKSNGGNQKRRNTRCIPKKKIVEAVSSPRITAIDAPFPTVAVVTPDLRCSKKPLPVECRAMPGRRSMLSGGGHMMAEFCPPTLSDSKDSADGRSKTHSGDEINFEGKHFHYLERGCFARAATQREISPPRPFHLEPRGRVAQTPMQTKQCRDFVSLYFPPIEAVDSKESSCPSEGPMSIERSLREPILTPSSSSSSLSMSIEDNEALKIDPDTIFSDDGFYGDWDIGSGYVDIDTEFKLLAG